MRGKIKFAIAVTIAALCSVLHAQTQEPRKIVSSAGNFSVLLPVGEPKDETATEDWFRYPSGDWNIKKCSSCTKKSTVVHRFGSLQHARVFLAKYEDTPVRLDDEFYRIDEGGFAEGVFGEGVVADVKKGFRQEHSFVTYRVTSEDSELGVVIENCFLMHVKTITGSRLYSLEVAGWHGDAPKPKEVSDFFDSFTLLEK